MLWKIELKLPHYLVSKRDQLSQASLQYVNTYQYLTHAANMPAKHTTTQYYPHSHTRIHRYVYTYTHM